MEISSPETHQSTLDTSPTPAPQRKIPLPQPGPSLLWLLLFVVAYFAGAMLYVAGYAFVQELNNPALSDDAQFRALVDDHTRTIAAQVGIYCVQFALLLPLLLWASHFHSQSWRETLGFKPFTFQQLALGLLALAVYLVFQTAGNYLVEVEPGPFLDAISDSDSIGLAFTMVVLAPILEELLFRGYLFKAWRHSALGMWGTLIATSLLFSAVHLAQYHWILGFYLFTFAMILGFAREKTGSIWLPIILHSANNLIAAILVVFLGME